jgi:hypothetical protein
LDVSTESRSGQVREYVAERRKSGLERGRETEGEEVKGEWHEIHEEEQHNVFSSPAAKENMSAYNFNPLTPELNPSAQRCLTRFFTGNFAS